MTSASHGDVTASAAPASAAAKIEFTARAIVTGMLIGAALTPCNVYSGLKIGWSFNMSIAAGLLGLGFWRLAEKTVGARAYHLHENNINQTTASAAASIISGGLVAPIPALTLLTGQVLSLPMLMFWVFAVSILGVVIAGLLRHQMILEEQLPFPAGVATAETMQQIHQSRGAGLGRLKVLFTGAGIAVVAKLAVDFVLSVPRFAVPFALPSFGAMRAAVPSVSFSNLTFAFDPSLLMLGFGAIIGLRAGISLLLGAVIAWGVLAPIALSNGWVAPGAADGVWFSELITWLLWPGVALIVVSSLVSFGISISRLKGGLHLGRMLHDTMGPRVFVAALAAATALVCLAAWMLFGLGLIETLVAVALSFVLAVVAARVTGETGITPVGALGKITQLTFGMVSPGNVTSNLMSANITGGAAGQCADLMHDLKTGHMIGATARLQILAQVFGVLIGSVVGALVYVALIPDPKAMLITEDWPAPAVATWKAVAEVLSGGLANIPPGAVTAMVIAGVLGAAIAVLEKTLPARHLRYLPSAPAVGLAFVLPAWNAISLFLGALGAFVLRRIAKDWAERNTLSLAAGLVAGESLAGVAIAYATFGG